MDEQQALEALENAKDAEDVLALEKQLIRQTDNRPRVEDGPQPTVSATPEVQE